MRPLALITGFVPFAGDAVNPSASLLAQLPDRFGDHLLLKCCLPVDTLRAPRLLVQALGGSAPRHVIHLGLAEKRETISMEMVARNVCDFRIPDEGGCLRRGAVVPGAPEVLGVRMPVELLEARWRERGIPVERSEDAGEFLCNQIFYESLWRMPADVGVAFVHLPPDEALVAWRQDQGLPLPQAWVPMAQQREALMEMLDVLGTLTSTDV